MCDVVFEMLSSDLCRDLQVVDVSFITRHDLPLQPNCPSFVQPKVLPGSLVVIGDAEGSTKNECRIVDDTVTRGLTLVTKLPVQE